jgi:ribonuclease HI
MADFISINIKKAYEEKILKYIKHLELEQQKKETTLQISFNANSEEINVVLIPNIMYNDDEESETDDEEEERKRIINENSSVMYSDGSNTKNGKDDSMGGSGVFFGDDDCRNVSVTLPDKYGTPTNNKCELYAIKAGLISFFNKTENIEDIPSLNIYSDSQYTIKSLTVWIHKWIENDWKNSKGEDVKNKELISEIYDLLEHYKQRINITFTHIKSHKKAPKDNSSIEYKHWYGNDMADKLAKTSYKVTTK